MRMCWRLQSGIFNLYSFGNCNQDSQCDGLSVLWNGRLGVDKTVWRRPMYELEVAGVTFSDSDSVPVPKFLNPGPPIFQNWESDSCSRSGYNHRSNRNLPVFYLRNDHIDSCCCRNWKVTPDPVFPKFLSPGPDPGPKEKRRILPESTSPLWIRSYLWYGCSTDDAWIEIWFLDFKQKSNKSTLHNT